MPQKVDLKHSHQLNHSSKEKITGKYLFKHVDQMICHDILTDNNWCGLTFNSFTISKSTKLEQVIWWLSHGTWVLATQSLKIFQNPNNTLLNQSFWNWCSQLKLPFIFSLTENRTNWSVFDKSSASQLTTSSPLWFQLATKPVEELCHREWRHQFDRVEQQSVWIRF